MDKFKVKRQHHRKSYSLGATKKDSYPGDDYSDPLRRSRSFSMAMKKWISMRAKVGVHPTNSDKAPKGILRVGNGEKKQSQEKTFRFNDIVLIGETFSTEEYERKSDFHLRLTPQLAHMIKCELNEFKSNEMAVHDQSKHLTHFFVT